MKKSDILSDVKSDIDTKRVFKTVNEISHYLDQQRNRIRNSIDLFSNVIESHRFRLCSYVEKLMFSAPLEYGRKCEEILWRKCFYDVYTTLKRLKKQEVWNSDEIALLMNLLYSGIGFYQHLIMRLQEEFHLNLDSVAEFPTYKYNYGLLGHVHDKRSGNLTNQSEVVKKSREWAENCVHRNLLYIGDLNRYMFDMYPGWDVSVAYRYYMKALYLKPEVGIPHNQLGTLSNSQNCTLDATYRYIRCLHSKEMFEGAEANLIAIMEQYPPIGMSYNNLPLKKRIFSQFSHLIGVWFLQKSPIKDVDQLCLEFIENINVWFPEPGGTTSILKHDPTSLQELVETKCIKAFDLPESENTIFKVLIIFIICHHKLQQKQFKGISCISSASTVIVAIISRTLEYVVNKLKETLPMPKPPLIEKENCNLSQTAKRRRRRRRIMKALSDDESSESTLSQNDDSDEDSEENLIFDEYSDDEQQHKTITTNGHSGADGKTNGITNGHSKKLKKEKKSSSLKTTTKFFQDHYHMMQVLKISFDWLRCNKDVMTPISGWKAVFENFAILLNYSSLLLNNVNEDDTMFIEIIPLPEDVELKDLQSLKAVQDKMCWKWQKIISLNLEQEMKHRICRLTDFGKYLTTLDGTNFVYYKEKCWFDASAERDLVVEKEATKKMDEEQRVKMMKEMGQLWLEAEVKSLENKVKQTAKANLLTPYLVVDSEALTQHCILVKKLVSSRQFVILIPAAVVSALDELKRTSGRARDAIRWLESQFRQGNRYLRMQRNNEKQSIPLVSYPRKKGNEAWMFMQIIECCYYLNNLNTNKNSDLAKKEQDSNFVRLVTGSRALCTLDDAEMPAANDKSSKQQVPFDMAVVKKSTGLLVEHIVDFYGKWKNSTKSHG